MKGTLEIDETAWSAEQFNDTLYSVFHEMMAQKGIEFTRQVVVNHHYVFCDPIKLREVFLNILSNAFKYTNPGGRVNMHLEEIPSDREGYALYRTTIPDTGIGISEAFLPHIFDEFARENNTTDNKIEGTGLGMPIVKRLVELLEGTIEVKSRKGVGTTVAVTLPHRSRRNTRQAYVGNEQSIACLQTHSSRRTAGGAVADDHSSLCCSGACLIFCSRRAKGCPGPALPGEGGAMSNGDTAGGSPFPPCTLR